MRDFFEELSGYDLYRLCVSGALVKLGRYDVKRCEIFVVQNIIALPRDHKLRQVPAMTDQRRRYRWSAVLFARQQVARASGRSRLSTRRFVATTPT